MNPQISEILKDNGFVKEISWMSGMDVYTNRSKDLRVMIDNKDILFGTVHHCIKTISLCNDNVITLMLDFINSYGKIKGGYNEQS